MYIYVGPALRIEISGCNNNIKAEWRDRCAVGRAEGGEERRARNRWMDDVKIQKPMYQNKKMQCPTTRT
jgi:hypothetical protein